MIQNGTTTSLEEATLPLNKVKTLAPIVMPPKIICLSLNYKDHAVEQGKTQPDGLVFFMRPHTTIIGPNQKIVKPNFVKQLDYEAELAIVWVKKLRTSQLTTLNRAFLDIQFLTTFQYGISNSKTDNGLGGKVLIPLHPLVPTLQLPAR